MAASGLYVWLWLCGRILQLSSCRVDFVCGTLANPLNPETSFGFRGLGFRV